MEYKEFEENLVEIIKKKSCESTKISLHEVSKNNGIKLTGLVIMKEGETVSPTIYLEHFYEMEENGEEIEYIADEIIKLCDEQKAEFKFDVEDFQDINVTKKKILYKIINYEKNIQLLSNIPHRRFKDLAIVYYVLISCDELGTGTILIRNEHLKFWDINEEQLYKCASENTPILLEYDLKSMADVILEFMEERILSDENNDEVNRVTIETAKALDDNAPIKMFVMGNTSKLNGACVILYPMVLEKFGIDVGKDFYILPSSVHEVILVPVDEGVDERELISLVREVNENNVSEEEWLSDNIYKYNISEKNIELIV